MIVITTIATTACQRRNRCRCRKNSGNASQANSAAKTISSTQQAVTPASHQRAARGLVNRFGTEPQAYARANSTAVAQPSAICQPPRSVAPPLGPPSNRITPISSRTATAACRAQVSSRRVPVRCSVTECPGTGAAPR